MPTSTTSARAPRRHDIDALRAIAFALLILYHWGMLYVGGDEWDWHLKSTHTTEWLQLPMLFVNRWRMDLIFLISGLSVHFLLRDAGAGRFVALRTWRLLLPLVFGMLVVVPIQPYAQGVVNGAVEPGFWRFIGDYLGGREWPGDDFDGSDGLTWNHLWYLGYLWLYTLVFAALLPLLRSAGGLALQRAFTNLRCGWLLVLPALPLLLATLVLEPLFGAEGDPEEDWYRHAVFFTMFLYGWWIGTDAGLWAELARLRRRALGWALGLFAVYATLVFTLPDQTAYWQQASIYTLRNAYIWSALCAILGWAHVLLNRPFRWLPWAREAVYPWYILHQSLIVLCAFWLLPLHVGPVLEPLLVIAGTVGGCWALHAFLRRVNLLRACFGMKSMRRAARSATTSPVAT